MARVCLLRMGLTWIEPNESKGSRMSLPNANHSHLYLNGAAPYSRAGPGVIYLFWPVFA